MITFTFTLFIDNSEVKRHWTSVTTPVIIEEEKYPDSTLLSQATSKTFLKENSVTHDDTSMPITDNSVYHSSVPPYNSTNVDLYGSYDEITDDVFQFPNETYRDDSKLQNSELTTSTSSHNCNPENAIPKQCANNDLVHPNGRDHSSVKYNINQETNPKSPTYTINKQTKPGSSTKRLHYIEVVATKQANTPKNISDEEQLTCDDIYANSSAVRFNALLNKSLSPTSCSSPSQKTPNPPETKPKPTGRGSISTGSHSTAMVPPRSRFLSHPGPLVHLVHHGGEEHIYMSPRPAGLPQDLAWKPYKEIEFATLDKESDYAVPSSTQ